MSNQPVQRRRLCNFCVSANYKYAIDECGNMYRCERDLYTPPVEFKIARQQKSILNNQVLQRCWVDCNGIDTYNFAVSMDTDKVMNNQASAFEPIFMLVHTDVFFRRSSIDCVPRPSKRTETVANDLVFCGLESRANLSQGFLFVVSFQQDTPQVKKYHLMDKPLIADVVEVAPNTIGVFYAGSVMAYNNQYVQPINLPRSFDLFHSFARLSAVPFMSHMVSFCFVSAQSSSGSSKTQSVLCLLYDGMTFVNVFECLTFVDKDLYLELMLVQDILVVFDTYQQQRFRVRANVTRGGLVPCLEAQ